MLGDGFAVSGQVGCFLLIEVAAVFDRLGDHLLVVSHEEELLIVPVTHHYVALLVDLVATPGHQYLVLVPALVVRQLLRLGILQSLLEHPLMDLLTLEALPVERLLAPL
jgi:hypothetical protein